MQAKLLILSCFIAGAVLAQALPIRLGNNGPVLSVQVAAEAGDTNVMAWYEFTDETACGNGDYQDSSVYGNDATQSTANLRPTWVDDSGGCLDFDGSDDRIIAANSSTLNFSNEHMSVSIWYNLDTYGSDQSIIDKRDGNNEGWNFWVKASTRLNWTMEGVSGNYAVAQYAGSGWDTTGVWRHVVGTYDTAGVAILYFDGVGVATNTLTSSPANLNFSGATDVYIGTEQDGSRPLNGKVDDARVYRKLLSAEEVATLYSEGR